MLAVAVQFLRNGQSPGFEIGKTPPRMNPATGLAEGTYSAEKAFVDTCRKVGTLLGVGAQNLPAAWDN